MFSLPLHRHSGHLAFLFSRFFNNINHSHLRLPAKPRGLDRHSFAHSSSLTSLPRKARLADRTLWRLSSSRKSVTNGRNARRSLGRRVKHLDDMRGTYAPRLVQLALPDQDSDIIGWSAQQVKGAPIEFPYRSAIIPV